MDGFAPSAERTVADLADDELLAIFPGATIEHVPGAVDLACEVIACALTGADCVTGRWWPSKPIRNGLAVAGIDDEPTVRAALERLGVEVRRHGSTGERWRLDHAPDLRRAAPEPERTAECGCGRRSAEWRLASGGAWQCSLCHPPAAGLEVERRELDVPEKPSGRLSWREGYGWRHGDEPDGDPLPPVAAKPDSWFMRGARRP